MELLYNTEASILPIDISKITQDLKEFTQSKGYSFKEEFLLGQVYYYTYGGSMGNDVYFNAIKNFISDDEVNAWIQYNVTDIAHSIGEVAYHQSFYMTLDITKKVVYVMHRDLPYHRVFLMEHQPQIYVNPLFGRYQEVQQALKSIKPLCSQEYRELTILLSEVMPNVASDFIYTILGYSSKSYPLPYDLNLQNILDIPEQKFYDLRTKFYEVCSNMSIYEFFQK